MRVKSIACVLLIAAAGISCAEDEWSWKLGEEHPAGTPNDGRSLSDESAVINIASLPLADQSDSIVYESLPPHTEIDPLFSQPIEADPSTGVRIGVTGEGELVDGLIIAQEGDREGRFLGLGDKLCSYGIGINCNKNKRDPQKSHYAPPKVGHHQGHYGPPKGTYGAPASYPPPPPTFPNRGYNVPAPTKGPPSALDGLLSVLKPFMPNSKPKGPPKISTKGVLSPSYTAPNPNYAPLLPSYTPPVKPAYQAPTPSYAAPQPAYSPPRPAYSQPSPPKAAYAPKPNYDVQPSYSISKVSYAEPKPVYVNPVKTVTVQAQPTVVEQHHHTHTHVYNDKNVHEGIYKDDHNGLLQSVHDSINQVNEYTIHRKDSSNSNDFALSGSQNVVRVVQPSVNRVVTKQQIPTSFPALSPSSPTIIPATLVGGTNFRPGKAETGFLPMPPELESLFRHQIPTYREDCQCVPSNFCPLSDIIPRNAPADIRNMIDARTRGTNILSNATDEETTERQTSSRRGKAMAFDDNVEETEVTTEIAFTEETTEEIIEDFTELATESVTEYEETTEIPESRRRRDADNTPVEQPEEEEEVAPLYSDRQGRQLAGFTPQKGGCGKGHVCCRRPVFKARHRQEYTCGRRSASGIHARVKSTPFIEGDTDFAEYPWQVAILKTENGDILYQCGGTLIDDRHVLTAAHCVDGLHPSVLKVRLGEWDVSAKSEFYTHVEMRASGAYLHPNYYKGNLNNDIAVVRLENYVDFSSNPHISPVCLPEKHSDFTNQRCHATGWGKDAFGSEGKFSKILKEVEVPVRADDECQYILQQTRLGPSFNLHEGNFCAGGEEGRDTCKGDGGGPLVCAGQNGNMQLAGLVSWGIGCGNPGVPGVYVKVSNYLDWIREITRI